MKSPKELILKYIIDNEIKHASVAKRLGTSPQNFWKKLQRRDIPASFITDLSKALKHNFYQDLGTEFELENRKNKPPFDFVAEPEMKYGNDEPVLRRLIREELNAILKPLKGHGKL